MHRGGHTWCATTSSAGTLRAVCMNGDPHATAAPCWAVVLLRCGVCHTCLQCHHTTPVCVQCMLLHESGVSVVCDMRRHTAVPCPSCIAWVVPTMHGMPASTVVMRRA